MREIGHFGHNLFALLSSRQYAEDLAMSEREPVIVFALFPGVTQLDFTGPHEVFSSLPGASVILASAEGGAIEATGGMNLGGGRPRAGITGCHVVCAAGGRGDAGRASAEPHVLARLLRDCNATIAERRRDAVEAAAARLAGRYGKSDQCSS